jgi:hypothetical protein
MIKLQILLIRDTDNAAQVCKTLASLFFVSVAAVVDLIFILKFAPLITDLQHINILPHFTTIYDSEELRIQA